jgi:transposase
MQESNSSPVIATKRRHSAAFKRKILELIEQPGASVAGVALEHGINANLVFKWRRAKLARKPPAGPARQTVLLPVSVDPQESFLTVPPGVRPVVVQEGVIEIELAGARLVLRGSVDPTNLRSVVLALRQTA